MFFNKLINFLKKINNYILFRNIFLLSIFLYLGFRELINKSHFFRGELAFIEITQLLLLIFTLLLLFKKKLIFYRKYNKYITNLKIIFFSFLLYEEISFITFNSFNIFKNINRQSEINIHNLNIWYSALFELPLLGSIGPIPILICLFLFLIGLGRYLNIPNYLHFFTLEKIYIPYSFIYFLNLFISRILSTFFDFSGYILLPELVEMLIYLILFFDLIEKMKFYNLKSK